MNKLLGLALAVIGGFALGGIALHRQEPVNSLWLVVASVCVYLLGYRFYSAWIAAKVYLVDPTRATPAERLNNGRDYVPTQRWVAFGHHFAAIAGPGPLVGPTLAAQFGYLPGTLWIIVGSVLGGCVQDMTILMLSMRRDGKSLGQMARDELGPVGGFAAGGGERHEAQPLGDLHGVCHDPGGHPGGFLHAQPAAGPGVGGFGNRGGADWPGGVWRRLDRSTECPACHV
jgi:hypothetical protein